MSSYSITSTQSNLLFLACGAIVGFSLNSIFRTSTYNTTTTTPTSPNRKPRHPSQNSLTPRNSQKIKKLSINTSNLTNKVVIVIGAKSKVGLAISHAVHAAGARLVMADKPRLEVLKKIAANMNGVGEENNDSPASRMHAAPTCAAVAVVDITDSNSVKRLAAKTLKTFDTLDLVINVSGIQSRTAMKDVEEKVWFNTMNINCNGLLNVFAAFLPKMIAEKSGHIISVSNEAGHEFFPKLTLYGATKQFVETMSTGTNQELAELGVRITTVQAGDCTKELNSEGLGNNQEFGGLNPSDVSHAVLYAATSEKTVTTMRISNNK